MSVSLKRVVKHRILYKRERYIGNSTSSVVFYFSTSRYFFGWIALLEGKDLNNQLKCYTFDSDIYFLGGPSILKFMCILKCALNFFW